MTPISDPNDPQTAHLDWRLTSLEKQIQENFANIDRRFDKLNSNIESLAYVSKELYNSEQQSQNKRMDEIESRQQWTLGLLISGILVALVAGLVRLAIG